MDKFTFTTADGRRVVMVQSDQQGVYLSAVLKITPTGRIKTAAGDFNSNGRLISGDTWARTFLLENSPENKTLYRINKTKRKIRGELRRLAVVSLDGLSEEQLATLLHCLGQCYP